MQTAAQDETMAKLTNEPFVFLYPGGGLPVFLYKPIPQQGNRQQDKILIVA